MIYYVCNVTNDFSIRVICVRRNASFAADKDETQALISVPIPRTGSRMSRHDRPRWVVTSHPKHVA